MQPIRANLTSWLGIAKLGTNRPNNDRHFTDELSSNYFLGSNSRLSFAKHIFGQAIRVCLHGAEKGPFSAPTSRRMK